MRVLRRKTIEDQSRCRGIFALRGRIDGDPTPGGYWWLAYEFTNYLLSCTICNQKNKRNSVSGLEGGLRVCYEDRPSCTRRHGFCSIQLRTMSKAVLFRLDQQRWTHLYSRVPGLLPMKSPVSPVNIEIFRVKQEGCSEANPPCTSACRSLSNDKRLDENRAKEEHEYAIRFRPHSIVARQILNARAKWALPSPEEESNGSFRTSRRSLITKLNLENPATGADVDEREAKELLWALAAIWKDPPAGDPEMIAAIVGKMGS